MATTGQTEVPLKAGRYLLAEKLGEGYLGPVFQAVDTDSQQKAAIRFPAWGRGWHQIETRLVLDDCAALVTLRHQGIVSVLDVGREAGSPYVVAELVPDGLIDAKPAGGSPTTVEKKLSAMIQSAEALGLAHSRGLLHGNLKPSKIAITPDGAVRIRDIGLSQILSKYLARRGVRWGRPIYLSPEQIEGKECSARSDIFSVGIIFYELLAGVHPFCDENGNRAVDKILNGYPPTVEDYLPDAPRGLSSLLRGCLERNPSDRFGTMEELTAACRGVLEDLISDTQVMLAELLAALRPLRAAAGRPGADPALRTLLRDVEGLSSGSARSDYAALDRMLSRLIEQYPAVQAASGDLYSQQATVPPSSNSTPSGVLQEPATVAAQNAASPPPEAARNDIRTGPACPDPPPVIEANQASPGSDTHGDVTQAVPRVPPPANPPVSHPTTIVIARKRVLPPFARIAALLSALLMVVAGYLVKGPNVSAFFTSVWSQNQGTEPVPPGPDSRVTPATTAPAQSASPQIISSETRAAILVEEAESFRIAGKNAECRALLTRALEIDPNQERAIGLMTELDEVAPNGSALRDPALTQALAGVSAMITAGQLPLAKVTLDRLQRQYPADPAVLAARRRWDARSAKEAREQARRDQELKEADRNRQKLEDEWSTRVGTLLREGKYADAGRDVAQWLAQSPKSASALGLRAKVDEADRNMRAFDDAFRNRRYTDALAALAAVEQANPSDVNIVELRRRVETSKASARASLSVYRLGDRGSLLLDGKPLGFGDELENVSIAAGSHMLVVRGQAVGSVSRVVECLDGQKIVLVYDLKRQLLRPMEDGDHHLLAQRRAAEETHSLDVEHVHGVFRGACRGNLLVGLPEIEFKPTAGPHRFHHPLRQLKLRVEGRSILLADAASGQEVFSFRAATPAQAADLGKAWDKLKALAK